MNKIGEGKPFDLFSSLGQFKKKMVQYFLFRPGKKMTKNRSAKAQLRWFGGSGDLKSAHQNDMFFQGLCDS